MREMGKGLWGLGLADVEFGFPEMGMELGLGMGGVESFPQGSERKTFGVCSIVPTPWTSSGQALSRKCREGMGHPATSASNSVGYLIRKQDADHNLAANPDIAPARPNWRSNGSY